ncbi:nitroreductase [Mesorhizobium sp. Cs1330R2N1]|uniref:Nitroreductase n=1 Tax=Mesorhizobium argentiipisi TaxID=3015175 RepID=A0ABU8K888_9HYPH
MGNAVPEGPLGVREAVVGRRSVRRFLPTPVPSETVSAILAEAARAPSATNMQPWKVYVVTGTARDRLCRTVLDAANLGARSDEYAYMPSPLKEPYLSRRRRVGLDLYRLYQVARDDMEGPKRVMLRNFEFFDAPVGLFFTMDRELLLGSWLDCGMFMQNVMILARAYGLETCPQQAWCEYGAILHSELSIPDDEIILSGMALGIADHYAPENSLTTERQAPHEFTTFRGT